MPFRIFAPLANKHFAELNPVDFGEEACKPNHSYGPAIRRYVLIHYVLDGCGVFTNERGAHKVMPGSAFIIRPEEVTVYAADKETPWHYIWVGFDGALATRFYTLPDVFTPPHGTFEKLLRVTEYRDTAEEYLAGRLFELYARLFSNEKAEENYIPRIRNYVENYYSSPCRIGDIASSLGLERHYLSRLYKEKTGETLKDYITNKKLTEAKALLRDGHSVADAAAMVGYTDQFLFSKTYKKVMGYAPSEEKEKEAAGDRRQAAEELRR